MTEDGRSQRPGRFSRPPWLGLPTVQLATSQAKPKPRPLSTSGNPLTRRRFRRSRYSHSRRRAGRTAKYAALSDGEIDDDEKGILYLYSYSNDVIIERLRRRLNYFA